MGHHPQSDSDHDHDHDQASSTPPEIFGDHTRLLSRRQWMGIAAAGAVTATGLFAFRRFGGTATTEAIPVALYAGEDCACCHKWAAHMEANGFVVSTTMVADVSHKKDALGVPADLRSCHTAEIAGYVVEGHVPATDIRRFLSERSAERGLAVSGMPGGSPGMESDPKVPFDVIAFSVNGTTRVYARG